MTDLVVKKGSKCFLSEVGHNNFLYPSLAHVVNLNKTIYGKKMPWLGGAGLTPVSILTQTISNLLSSKTVKMLGNCTHSIVWVDPNACLDLKS